MGFGEFIRVRFVICNCAMTTLELAHRENVALREECLELRQILGPVRSGQVATLEQRLDSLTTTGALVGKSVDRIKEKAALQVEATQSVASDRVGPDFVGKGPIYCVKHGRTPGYYLSWSACEAQIFKFSGSVYKKFGAMEQAKLFMGQGTCVGQESFHEPSLFQTPRTVCGKVVKDLDSSEEDTVQSSSLKRLREQ